MAPASEPPPSLNRYATAGSSAKGAVSISAKPTTEVSRATKKVRLSMGRGRELHVVVRREDDGREVDEQRQAERRQQQREVDRARGEHVGQHRDDRRAEGAVQQLRHQRAAEAAGGRPRNPDARSLHLAEVGDERDPDERAPLHRVDSQQAREDDRHARHSSDDNTPAVASWTLRAPVSTAKACSSVGRCGALRDGVGRAFRDRPPLVDDDDARAQPLDDVEQMGAEEDGAPLRRQAAQQFLEHQHRVRVEAVERLVEDDHVGRVQQRGGNQHLLSHPLRERHHACAAHTVELEHAEQFLDPRLHDLGIEAIEHRDEAEVLVGRERVIQRAGFGHVADAPLDVERMRRDVEARHLDLAALQRQEPGQDLDRGGLAGAIRPQQTEHFPHARLEREPLHRRGLAIGVVEVDDTDHTESVPAAGTSVA